MRRITDSKFKWLPIEDIVNQIEMILKPPIISIKNDHIISFIYSTDFKNFLVFKIN